MDYRWFGAIHIVAGILWISGMLMLAITTLVYARNNSESLKTAPLISGVRSWNRKIASPAMIIVWLCGIILVAKGGFLFHPWFLIKLAALIFLSAAHGILSKSVRRLALGEPVTPSAIVRHATLLIIIALTLIVVMAKLKPVFF